MIEFGFDKLALIGAVALIVIGPEKLPKVARTIGHLVGKAQRYVADVRSEVNRSIELDELKKMKTQFEDAARDVESSVQQQVNDASSSFEKDWASIGSSLDGTDASPMPSYEPLAPPPPEYRHPRKKWRLKRGSTPQWYKQRQGVRTKAQSGAARVARFRPPGLKSPR
jgi:sec-independent protein translocase protein TatB